MKLGTNELIGGTTHIRISRWLWKHLISELHKRGEDRRESGAFLLGDVTAGDDSQSGSRIRRILYYDDLDATCLTGGIQLSGKAYDALWSICAKQRLTVLADVHTHPTKWVEQSPMDASNPMIASSGHIAMIIPGYAAGKVTLEDVGIHLYLGKHEWSRLSTKHAQPVRVTAVGNFSRNQLVHWLGLAVSRLRRQG